MGAVTLTASRPPRARRLVAVSAVAAGIAFALWAEGIRLAADWPIEWVIVDVVPGLAFLVCGLVAVLRRRDSAIGPAMIATGFAWYAGTATASMNPLIDRLGYAFQGYYDGLLAWLVLAYPNGRIRDPASRVAVAALFVLLATRTVFRAAVFRLNTDYDFTVPGEVERYIADQTLRETGELVFHVGIALLMAAVLVLLVRRLRSETAPTRRIALPMIVAGGAVTAGVLVKLAALVLATTPAERFGAWALGDVVTSVSGTAVAVAFVVGLVRGRLARQSVADLVVELDRAEDHSTLREVLARALGDPSVEVLYPDPAGGYFDAGGARAELIGKGTDRVVTRIEVGERTVAVLVHDAALAEQPELLRSVVAAVRLAIENERLAAEVRAQLAEVRASRARIIAAGDEQRRRIERDLHDGAQQRLVTLALRLEMARSAVRPADAELTAALNAASTDLEAAIAELRELARGLHPSALASDGLRVAIEALAARMPLPVTVDVLEERFAPAIESTAYFVVAEALTNVVRYARATRASVTIDSADGQLRIGVNDDGVGGADPGRGSGLRGLEDRVAAVGGRLTVESESGRGTVVHAELPCA